MDEYDEYIEWLVEEGAFRQEVNDCGEKILFMNPPVLKELCKPLYDHMMAEFDAELIELVDKGYVDMEWDDVENDFVFRVSEWGAEQLNGYQSFE